MMIVLSYINIQKVKKRGGGRCSEKLRRKNHSHTTVSNQQRESLRQLRVMFLLRCGANMGGMFHFLAPSNQYWHTPHCGLHSSSFHLISHYTRDQLQGERHEAVSKQGPAHNRLHATERRRQMLECACRTDASSVINTIRQIHAHTSRETARCEEV